MNTKEAINILGEKRRNINFDIVPKYENADKIIELLQRGKKFEQMWRELKLYGIEKLIIERVKYLEQKYFPKTKTSRRKAG